MVKVIESGLHKESSINSTITQNGAFATFVLSEKIEEKVSFCHIKRPAAQANSDHYIDSHFHVNQRMMHW